MIDRQIPLYGRMALFRYLELVERMAVLPGKKIIVLFRAGLRFDEDNNWLMTYVLGEAQRRRVVFFTADSRGLDPVIPADEGFISSIWGYQRRHAEVDVANKLNRRVESEQGLYSLANGSGGSAVLDSNDLSVSLRDAVASAEDYYVLTHYPTRRREEGRFRKISVRVDTPKAQVSGPRGYYEPRPFQDLTKLDRSIELHAALRGDIAPDFPLAVTHDFFAAPDRTPVLVMSSGVAPGNLKARLEGTDAEFALLMVSRIRPEASEALPTWTSRKIRHKVAQESLENRAGDPTFLLTSLDGVPSQPGAHQIQLVVRDERSGRMGAFEGTVEAPSFDGPSRLSTLLLSRSVRPYNEEQDGREPLVSLLRFGDAVFSPVPSNMFRVGERIHLLLHLYSPPVDAAGTIGLGVLLLRDGQAVPDVKAGGEKRYSEADDTLRFAAALETAGLEPGGYEVVMILSDSAGEEISRVGRAFTLLGE